MLHPYESVFTSFSFPLLLHCLMSVLLEVAWIITPEETEVFKLKDGNWVLAGSGNAIGQIQAINLSKNIKYLRQLVGLELHVKIQDIAVQLARADHTSSTIDSRLESELRF
ncbi:hypothetical protein BDP27DRAFT_1318896 [Rhodocollybia butyracea]|uniref:Uncharacterized protein n=1 Tax=Rhodocollybia butyracea TaxID=206335 RepID=A0A9P5Q0U4_9AGAR|nr:hypothetical protein BDP27DRAFT_1318896 [Rhodocollybia butyracea]